jgi:Spx/MgsR family transcriptional regulator
MTITAYLYNSCTSCRKTDQMLKESGVEYERREFFRDRFTKDELKALLERHGLTVADVISTRSTPYKQNDLANKQLSDDQILDLMVEDPRLLRRPLVVSGDKVVIGHNAAMLQELIAES